MQTVPCHRFEGDVDDTEQLLAFVLTHFNSNHRISFICPAGKGAAIMSRLRAKLSRVRKKLKEKGKRQQHFYMLSDVKSWTSLDGKRSDCVFVTKKVTQGQEMLERFEAQVGHSGRL